MTTIRFFIQPGQERFVPFALWKLRKMEDLGLYSRHYRVGDTQVFLRRYGENQRVYITGGNPDLVLPTIPDRFFVNSKFLTRRPGSGVTLTNVPLEAAGATLYYSLGHGHTIAYVPENIRVISALRQADVSVYPAYQAGPGTSTLDFTATFRNPISIAGHYSDGIGVSYAGQHDTEAGVVVTYFSVPDKHASFAASDDGGKTWTLDEFPIPLARIVPELWYLGDNTVITLAMQDQPPLASKMIVFRSEDGGFSWSSNDVPHNTPFIEERSVWPIVLDKNKLLLIDNNPLVSGGPRTIWFSSDAGATWGPQQVLNGALNDQADYPAFYDYKTVGPDEALIIAHRHTDSPVSLNNEFSFFRTIDGGLTWTETLPPVPTMRLRMITPPTVVRPGKTPGHSYLFAQWYTPGIGQQDYVSYDSGATWTPVATVGTVDPDMETNPNSLLAIFEQWLYVAPEAAPIPALPTLHAD